ncbi:hypothetical protein CspHIS471_0102120 [Cutaneotrichosporon sp. HIS471]|nr:hypothetical protein CspHIS471_0102120 [Cutaneotrichosporon sp. HIS471]
MPAKTRPRPRPSSATGPRDVADIMLSWLGLDLASWGFWGNTEWLEARVRHILADAGWRTWLKNELKYTK